MAAGSVLVGLVGPDPEPRPPPTPAAMCAGGGAAPVVLRTGSRAGPGPELPPQPAHRWGGVGLTWPGLAYSSLILQPSATNGQAWAQSRPAWLASRLPAGSLEACAVGNAARLCAWLFLSCGCGQHPEVPRLRRLLPGGARMLRRQPEHSAAAGQHPGAHFGAYCWARARAVAQCRRAVAHAGARHAQRGHDLQVRPDEARRGKVHLSHTGRQLAWAWRLCILRQADGRHCLAQWKHGRLPARRLGRPPGCLPPCLMHSSLSHCL